MFQTCNNFEIELDVLEYTPTNNNLEVYLKPSFSSDSFDITYLADIIFRTSRVESEHSAQELLKFPHTSTLNEKQYNSGPLVLFQVRN